MKRLAIFIVNYNGLSVLDDLLFKCLDSFAAITEKFSFTDLWFVDNGSSDASVEKVKKRYGDKFKYIILSQNLGYGAACNIAYVYTKKLGLHYKYYICSNNDVQIFYTKLDDLLHKLAILEKEYPKGFIAAPVLLNGYDGFVDFGGFFIDEAGGTWPLRLVLFNKNKVKYMLKKPVPVSYCDGAFLIVHRNVTENLGWFNPYFFLYYEDVELSLRAWNKGYPTLLIPLVLGKHYRSASTKRISKLATYFSIRNRIYSILCYRGYLSLFKLISWFLFYFLRIYEIRSSSELQNPIRKVMPGIIIYKLSYTSLLVLLRYVTRALLEGLVMFLKKRKSCQSSVNKNMLFLKVGFTDMFSQKKIIIKLQKQMKQIISSYLQR